MNVATDISDARQQRARSVVLCLLGFVTLAAVGLALHYYVMPLPVKSGTGLIARYAYFLAWLGALIFLAGRAIFGRHSELWHASIFFLLGGFLGILGGFFFAGILGMLVGALSGVIVGPLVFLARKRQNKDAGPGDRADR